MRLRLLLASCGVHLSQAAERPFFATGNLWLHFQVVSSCHQFEVARFLKDKTRQQIRRHVVDRESRQYAARREKTWLFWGSRNVAGVWGGAGGCAAISLRYQSMKSQTFVGCALLPGRGWVGGIHLCVASPSFLSVYSLSRLSLSLFLCVHACMRLFIFVRPAGRTSAKVYPSNTYGRREKRRDSPHQNPPRCEPGAAWRKSVTPDRDTGPN